MRAQAVSFLRESVQSYLTYMMVGLATLPAAILYALMALRGPVSAPAMTGLAAFALSAAAIAVRSVRVRPMPVSQYAIISFNAAPGSAPMRTVTTAVAASVLIVCLARDNHGVLNGLKIDARQTESADQFFCIVPAVS